MREQLAPPWGKVERTVRAWSLCCCAGDSLSTQTCAPPAERKRWRAEPSCLEGGVVTAGPTSLGSSRWFDHGHASERPSACLCVLTPSRASEPLSPPCLHLPLLLPEKGQRPAFSSLLASKALTQRAAHPADTAQTVRFSFSPGFISGPQANIF